MCEKVVEKATQHLARCDQLVEELNKVQRAAGVHGRGYHSKKQLEKSIKEVEEVYRLDKEITSVMKAIQALMIVNPL